MIFNSEMRSTISVLIYLISLTSWHVHTKVITVNTTGGSDSDKCCVEGDCPCSSLYTALQGITKDTVINIISQSITLHEITTMGSGHLTNITIAGNGATIMCGNSGSVYCDWCHNVIIEGTTWDKCGHSHLIGVRPAGIEFHHAANLSIINCTFQNSKVVAVVVSNAYDNVVVKSSKFSSNRKEVESYVNDIGGLYISSRLRYSLNIMIDDSVFNNNGYFGYNLSTYNGYGLGIGNFYYPKYWNITISRSTFFDNSQACTIDAYSSHNITLLVTEVFVFNSTNRFGASIFEVNLTTTVYGSINVAIVSSVFSHNNGAALGVSLTSNQENVILLISNSNFTENLRLDNPIVYLSFDSCGTITSLFNNVGITDNTVLRRESIRHGILSGIIAIQSNCTITNVTMTEVRVMSNVYYYEKGGAVYITNLPPSYITFDRCIFSNNTSVRGAAIYIDEQFSSFSEHLYHNHTYLVSIKDSVIDSNKADESIVFVDVHAGFPANFDITTSNFTNNIGVCCMLLSRSAINLAGNVLFKNNSADSGAAIYLNELSTIAINDGAVVEFADNSALSHGGAIFVELSFGCNQNHTVFKFLSHSAVVLFTDTTADGSYGDNTIYFSVSTYCNINLNYNESNSIMYVPYQFNYSQVINGSLVHISTNNNYTGKTVSHFPVVTSPHQLKLYGNNVESVNNAYFIRGQILNKAVTFDGMILDYFDKPADTTDFHLKCSDCSNKNYTLLSSKLEVDNLSQLYVIIIGKEINRSAIANITLSLQSHYYLQIEVTLVIELVPCPNYPGYMYSATSKGCVCYHHDLVECYNDYNEIKIGNWFGNVDRKATTSLCPNRYCRFVDRKMTRQDYFELPNKIDDQCEHYRSGPACGECSPRHTLAYDSTDCISVDRCSAGMTLSVIVLTCLYWVIVVVGVFGLMYVSFHLHSGYFYGIVYYYSMLSILLNTNPYISSWAILFIDILSGFAQSTPTFLGPLCLAEGLSGIDQLFIHYSHAVAISLVLLSFVLVAKRSRRVSKFIGRCIIRVFCFLLLLAYTSLASTSLQLLRPLKFTDINEVYTYSSPSVKFFHGRHLVYGTVALLFELIIGIGLPMLLVLEPLLKRKVNFIRIKPILDQFQGCYKDKDRWFAGYYLMCRQLIMLIVFIWSNNYYNMLFYLQSACIIIATIHLLFQPYKNKFLNIFDGVILQLMIVVVNISTFDFLRSATTEVALVLAVLPLIVICSAGAVKKFLHSRIKQHQYVAIAEDSDDNDNNGDNENNLRDIHSDDSDLYNHIQEPLLDISARINN